MNKKYNWLLHFSTITLSLGGVAALLFYLAASEPDVLVDKNKKNKSIAPKDSGPDVNYSISNDVKSETFKVKTSDSKYMKTMYLNQSTNGKTKDGIDVYLTTDNNHKPCYISGSDLISHSGKKIPFNFVPPSMRCDSINVVNTNFGAAIETNSIDLFLDEKTKYPSGYAFKIDGQGLSGTVVNCGEYWSDNCKIPSQAKVIITNKGPADVPSPRSVDSIVLTSKLPNGFINGSKSKWNGNELFYVWKRVPFKSKLSVNSMADGKYVDTTREAYEKGYDVSIVLKEGKILINNSKDGKTPCLIDEDGKPVNIDGESLPTSKFPDTLNCKNAQSLNNTIVATNLSEFINWKDAPSGYKIITSGLVKNIKNIELENCGSYWSDNCKKPEIESIAIGKTRMNIPGKRSKNRNVFTTTIGESKTNMAGGNKISDSLYYWEDVETKTAVNGLSDIYNCGYSSNCYFDKLAISAQYAKAPNKQYVKYKLNENGIGLWVSFDGVYVLSPSDNNQWDSIKQQHLINGISKDGKFFYIGKEEKTFIEASKECSSIGMVIPSTDDTDIGNKNGISTNSWAWVLSKESNSEYAVWKKGTLSRDTISNKNKVICVSR